jgi:hypothetical protein
VVPESGKMKSSAEDVELRMIIITHQIDRERKPMPKIVYKLNKNMLPNMTDSELIRYCKTSSNSLIKELVQRLAVANLNKLQLQKQAGK